MDILIISLLLILGLIFCIVELLVLPGFTVTGVLSCVCNGGAIYMAFNQFGVSGGIIVVVLIGILTFATILLSLRAKTWDRLSLKSEISSASSQMPQAKLTVGQCGVAVSRLSPMGKIEIDGSYYEAKSCDTYIDAKTQIEVVGFENSSVIVKRVNN